MGYYFLENIMASNYDTSVVQGDTLKFLFYLQNPTGTTGYNLSGCTLAMQVRKGYYPATLVSTYQTYIPVGSTPASYPEGFIGGLSASATGGTVYISLGSSYTSQLASEATAKYDIQIKSPTDTSIQTILRGSLTIVPDVTRI
tara:strand:- start:388 stop:816 length:429 start_codon:yes stop_codon:yes gene_type:complete